MFERRSYHNHESVTPRARPSERVGTFVVPAQKNLFVGIGEMWHVNLYRVALPNTVQAAYSLLEQVGILWQVQQNQMMMFQ